MKKLSWLPWLAVPVLLFAIVLTASGNLGARTDADAAVRLETSLHRAIAVEYAVSGAYPESLAQITENYQIRYDAGRFAVYYVPVAENLPPDLTVLDLTEQEAANEK